MSELWCTCDPNRRNSDGSENGPCAYCEDAPYRDLLETHADGDPPTLNQLEDYECPALTTATCFAAPMKSAPSKHVKARSATGSARIIKPTESVFARR